MKMGQKKPSFIVVLLIYFATWIEAERVMRPKIKDLKVWSDNVYATHSIAFDGNDPHINITVVALQEVQDVDLHLEAKIVQKQDPNYFLAFNVTMNACRLVNWSKQSPIGSLVHAYLEEYGKLVDSCPIPKGTKLRFYKHFHRHKFQGKYFIHKFWPPEDPSTADLPEADFDIVFQTYHVDGNKQRTLIMNDHIVGEAVVQDVSNIKSGIFSMLPKGG